MIKLNGSKFLVAGVFACASVVFDPIAKADTVTFNGSVSDGDSLSLPIGFIYTEKNFQFEVIESEIFLIDNDANVQLNTADDDVLFFQSVARVRITAITESIFDLNSVSTIGSFDGRGTLEFTGFFADGETTSIDVPVENSLLTETEFTNFTNLTSLEIFQTFATGQFLSVDTINFRTVPEPAGISLFFAMLVALLRRHNRQTTSVWMVPEHGDSIRQRNASRIKELRQNFVYLLDYRPTMS